jgi:hypothetical protein
MGCGEYCSRERRGGRGGLREEGWEGRGGRGESGGVLGD